MEPRKLRRDDPSLVVFTISIPQRTPDGRGRHKVLESLKVGV